MDMNKVELTDNLKMAYRDAHQSSAVAIAQPMELTVEHMKEVFGGVNSVFEK